MGYFKNFINPKMKQTRKNEMPVEHLRSLSNKKYSTLGCFKYLPLSLHTLLRTMPMPWEDKKTLKILYHINGNLCFVLSKHKISEYEYKDEWEKINREVKEFKINNPNYRTLGYPIFDDEEEIFEYSKLKESPIDSFVEDCKINVVRRKDYLIYLDIDSTKKRKKAKKSNLYDISLYNKIPTNLNLNHIKRNNLKRESKIKNKKPHTNILKLLKNTRYFQTTQMEWLEVALLILKQGHKMLDEILTRKKLYYLYIDKNFNLKPKRSLKTKERKKSRVGVSFHLTREILKLMKFVVDSFVLYKLKNINKFELCISLKNLFSKVGIVTGIYRYKYKVMNQIKLCKDIEKIIDHFEDTSWCEMWRRYVFMTRGYNSLLKEYITNLTERIINGREVHDKVVTKQRKESNFDIEIKNMMIDEMEGKYSKEQIKMILRHFNEAWKCWKGDVTYEIPAEECTELNSILRKYVQIKSEWYIKEAINGRVDSKKDFMKKMGKITRLFFKEERYRQNNYLLNMSITPIEALKLYKVAYSYFYNRDKITFPEKNCEKHLQIAVEKLSYGAPEEEREFYNKVLDDMSSYIFQIRKNILTQRKFRDINATIFHSYDKFIVTYNVNYLEKLTDAFLCSYLFFETDRKNIFPDYIKPGDEIEAKTIRNLCCRLNEYFDRSNIFLFEGRYDSLMQNIDNNLLSRMLKIFIDPIVVDYMISRNNSKIFYKDMSYINSLGFINGLQFSSFIQKFYTFVIDLCVFGDIILSKDDYIKYFIRDIDKVYAVIEITDTIKKELIKNCRNRDIKINQSNNHFQDENDEEIKKAFYLEFGTRLPKSIGKLEFINVSPSSRFCFTYAGVDILISEKVNQTSYWELNGNRFANFIINQETLKILNFRIKQIIKLGVCSTFIKTISKWNNTILGFISRYREFIDDTPEIETFFTWAEKSIQTLIKKGINSKMPARFPAILFYTPVTYGGLGMYSVMKKYCENFNKKFANEEDIIQIPDLRSYFMSWKDEFKQSDEVWKEFKKSEKIEPRKGIPRMSTLLQRDKVTFYDRNFRLQNIYKRYTSPKYDPFIYTLLKHDGKLWNLDNYSLDMISALGGADEILKHSLYQATYAKKFDKLFWDDSYLKKYKNANTKAQKTGLNQIPNRRFILWWSPTINTTNVYVGYQVQLEPTGIFMHGKLPTLKISFIQLFRNNLWFKIHENIVSDLQNVLKLVCDVEVQNVPTRKSINFNVGCSDLVLTGNFYVSEPCSLTDQIKGDLINVKKLWIDVQLRWGDFDKNDCNKYAKVKYVEYVSNPMSNYQDRYGLVIVFDLCYNTYAGYGYSSQKMTKYLTDSSQNILKNNLSLHILRERLRKTLEIYTSEVENVVSSKEMYFDSLIVDDRPAYKTSRTFLVFDPESGNLYYKKIDDKEGNKNRHLRNLISESIFELANRLNKQNILIRSDLYDSVEAYMIDYRNINIKIYENKLHLKSILKILPLEGYTEFRIINLYKNWFGTTSFTNFCRLVLLIQAYEINSEYFFDKKAWSVYSDSEWISIEKECKDIIINDYCGKKVINKHKLLTTDIRDIVFGFDVNTTDYKLVTEDIISWEDKYKVMDEYLKQALYRSNRFVQNEDSENSSVLQIPESIFSIFKRCTDINTYSFCLLIQGSPISLLFVPQFSTKIEIHSANSIPQDIQVIGLIVNFRNEEILDSILKKYSLEDPIIVICNEYIEINKGYKLIKEEVPCYTPDIWNYNMSKEIYSDDLVYDVELGIPCEFYSGYNFLGLFMTK
jgi:pre-mRNA-processing factor 8